MLDILKKRFEGNMQRHPGMAWADVEKRLLADEEALKSLQAMEDSGGEPDVIAMEGDRYVFCDCSAETPAGRRSVCYDEKARAARKKNPPASSAEAQAEGMGCELMDEDLYRYLQTLGEYDRKTSSWIRTPQKIRDLGGALFCERRYDTVFTFHNGADSYYGVRGFRGIRKV